MTRPRRSRPEIGVLLVGTLSLVITLGALMFARYRTDHYQRDVAAIEIELAAPLADLRAAGAAYEESQDDFALGIAAPSSEVAGNFFSKALTETGEGDQRWARFAATPARLRGEEDARRAVDTALEIDAAAGEALGIAVLDPVRDPAEVASLQARQDAAHDEVRRTLRNLEDRYYVPALTREITDSRRDAERSSTSLAFAAVVLAAVAGTITVVGYRRTVRASEAEALVRERQDLTAHENALDAELQHALDMTDVEADVHDVIGRALATPDDPHPADFLLADSSIAHFSHVVGPDESRGTRCGVLSPQVCPVTRHGQQSIFRSSDALDACTHLREHPAAPCAAVCVPVSIAGRAIGVIHECHPDGAPPPEHRVRELEIVARKAGERLSMIRAFATSQVQAHTDPLTGLLNRRSLEEAVAAFGNSDLPFSVAFADLDHFKVLNDTFGHDTGDKALRLFATVLRSSVRPADVVCRYGGEEFVVVLPGCTPPVAVTVMERVRQSLADAVLTDAAPHFTVSIGIAAAATTSEFDEVLALADGGLLHAKALGRDRIIVSGAPDPASVDPEVGGAGHA